MTRRTFVNAAAAGTAAIASGANGKAALLGGAPVRKQPRYGAYREDDSVLRNTVERRFTAVDPATRFTAESGFGWLDRTKPEDGHREAAGIPLTPYLEMKGVAKDPQSLPHDVLYRD